MNGRFAWCRNTGVSIRRCGLRLNPLRRRSAVCPTAEKQRVKELERENKELRRANEILKLASAFFAQAELDRRLKS